MEVMLLKARAKREEGEVERGAEGAEIDAEETVVREEDERVVSGEGEERAVSEEEEVRRDEEGGHLGEARGDAEEEIHPAVSLMIPCLKGEEDLLMSE